MNKIQVVPLPTKPDCLYCDEPAARVVYIPGKTTYLRVCHKIECLCNAKQALSDLESYLF